MRKIKEKQKADTKMAPIAVNRGIPVLVTTSHKGVFFGYLDGPSDGSIVRLTSARNCLYWPASNRGFLGLAAMGPKPGARVGPPADIELRDVTCVAKCTPEAVPLWESAPW